LVICGFAEYAVVREISMLTAERNEMVTRIGPGTPAGKLMRLYWHPAALVEELDAERPVKAVELLGERLVVFRDRYGCYGLVGRACPHRGADLAFGRLEDGALRCSFHGWLFDIDGNCLETPAEPEGSKLHTKVRHNAYPVRERSGILFAYLGPGDPPAFPHFDCFVAPDQYTFAFKDISLAIGCRPSRSVSIPLTPRFSIDSSRIQIRMPTTASSFARPQLTWRLR
jgi:phthalate 4,5-dioxygenase